MAQLLEARVGFLAVCFDSHSKEERASFFCTTSPRTESACLGEASVGGILVFRDAEAFSKRTSDMNARVGSVELTQCGECFVCALTAGGVEASLERSELDEESA